MTREDIRQVLINKYNCRQAGPSVNSQKETVLTVSRMITRHFRYTEDHKLPSDNFLNIKKGNPEQWVSQHVALAEGNTRILGDCDDYTMTGIQCALILGVNPSRLAAVAVVYDDILRSSLAVKPQIDHLTGGFFDGQNWLACFDTWNTISGRSYLKPIGIGRRPPPTQVHSGQLIAVAIEGFKWRAYPDSWFRFKPKA